jgi:hypothetical protein
MPIRNNLISFYSLSEQELLKFVLDHLEDKSVEALVEVTLLFQTPLHQNLYHTFGIRQYINDF